MDPHRDTVFSSTPTQVVASSSTISHTSASQDQAALITTAPELRLRDAVPEPQNGNTCSQAEQSASQAIQQASQQASQSIQQASQQAAQLIQQAQQQASQAAQSAARSASQAIQEASIQASNSIAAASRSVTSAMTSASFAIASIQSSADQAISRANGSMFSAQASATAAQVRYSPPSTLSTSKEGWLTMSLNRSTQAKLWSNYKQLSLRRRVSTIIMPKILLF